MKYCPACGSKNGEYEYSSKINEIKSEIKKSNYYESKSKKEIAYLGLNPGKKGPIKGKTCPNCGVVNELDSEFCMDCGAALSDSNNPFVTGIINICPNCNAIVQKDDTFCGECGKEL